MVSISAPCSSSSTLKPQKFTPKPPPPSPRPRELIQFPNRSNLFDRFSVHSMASFNQALKKENKELEKDPRQLWWRYVDWLYQHKELGFYLDVSRVGFTDQFVEAMEPKFQAAFRAIEELEKGATVNGKMVGHYWLRNPNLSPNSFLRSQIESTIELVRKFADDVISGKIKPPSSPEDRFKHVLSVGVGGSAIGPQFVAEALALDDPPLKIRFIDNTDPAGIDNQIAQLGPELASTLVIVISKSGRTPETRNGLLEVQKAFREAGLNFAKQVLISGQTFS